MSADNNHILKKRSTKKANSIMMFIYVLLIILIVTSVYYFTIERKLVDALKESNDKTVEQYVDKVSYKANVYIALSRSITSNIEIKNVLRQQNELDVSNTIDIHKLFKNAINKNLLINDIEELNEITVFALDENFPTDGKFVSNIGLGDNQWWFDKVSEDVGSIVFQKPKTYIKGQISFVGPIIDYDLENYGELLGYVKIDVDAEAFFVTNDLSEGFLILDENGFVVFGIESEIDDSRTRTKVVELGNDHLSGTFEVVYEENYRLINKQINQSRLYLFIVVIIIVGIMFFVRENISRSYLQRIDRMITKIKRIETGDFTNLTVDEGKDEIGVLDYHFNEMAMKLDDLISKTYLQQLENKEAKIKALQYQIDPHFLFNTLESINALAIIDDNEDISNIIESLGLIYRYIVDKESGDIVTLKQELNHAKNYIKIQQYRFGFDVVYDVDPSFERCLVPKLTMQPFIENAINYAKGLSDRKLRLSVEVQRISEDLVIEISDNGVGIDEDLLVSLQKNLDESTENKKKGSKRSIGIQNVNQRIKLNYGEKYGVRLHSEAGCGTTIRIHMPFIQ